MQTIKDIVERSETRLGRAFDLFIQLLIVLSLIAFSVETLPNLSPETFASVFHSLWWAVAALTTVGYGVVYPITLGGRIFTFVVLLVGLGIVSVPAGLVASALSKARELETD